MQEILVLKRLGADLVRKTVIALNPVAALEMLRAAIDGPEVCRCCGAVCGNGGLLWIAPSWRERRRWIYVDPAPFLHHQWI